MMSSLPQTQDANGLDTYKRRSSVSSFAVRKSEHSRRSGTYADDPRGAEKGNSALDRTSVRLLQHSVCPAILGYGQRPASRSPSTTCMPSAHQACSSRAERRQAPRGTSRIKPVASAFLLQLRLPCSASSAKSFVRNSSRSTFSRGHTAPTREPKPSLLFYRANVRDIPHLSPALASNPPAGSRARRRTAPWEPGTVENKQARRRLR